jgi:MFS family permease
MAPFLAVLALAGLGGGLARVATSLHAVTLRASPADLGLLAAGQGLGLVLMSLPTGALVRRHGPAAVFVAGSVLGALACAAMALVDRPRLLVACFTALSFCMPARLVATQVVILERLDREGHARAGRYRGLMLLNMLVVGPAIAVPVVATLGFPATWGFVAAAFALPSLWARRALDAARPAPGTGFAPALRIAGADPETRLLAVTELAAQGTVTCCSFFIIPVAVERHGFAAPAAAWLLSAQAACFVAALLTLGGVAARWGRARFVATAYGAVGAGLLLLGLAPGPSWLWAGGLVLGGGLGLVQLDNLIRSARVGARVGQAAASGLQHLGGSSGGLVVGLLGGLMGRALGPPSVFLLLAPLFAWLAWRQLAWRASPLPAEVPESRPRIDTKDNPLTPEHSWATRASTPPASPSTIRSTPGVATPSSRRRASERCSST